MTERGQGSPSLSMDVISSTEQGEPVSSSETPITKDEGSKHDSDRWGGVPSDPPLPMSLRWEYKAALPLDHLTFMLSLVFPQSQLAKRPTLALWGKLLAQTEGLLKRLGLQDKVHAQVYGETMAGLAIPQVIKKDSNEARYLPEVPITILLVQQGVTVLHDVYDETGKDKDKKEKKSVTEDKDKTGEASKAAEESASPEYQVGKKSLREAKFNLFDTHQGVAVDHSAVFGGLSDVCSQVQEHLSSQTEGMDITVIPAIHCGWPKAAHKWLKTENHSGWPSSETISMVQAQGCHLVPSDKTDDKWQYSFDAAYQKLYDDLTDTMRHSYILMKILYYEGLRWPQVLNYRQLRCCFYACLAKVHARVWTPDNLGTCAMFVFDELFHRIILEEVHDPFLPFLEYTNPVNEDFLQDTLTRMSNIRDNPIKTLTDFLEGHRLPCGPFSQNPAAFVQGVINDAKKQAASNEPNPTNGLQAFIESGTQAAQIMVQDTFKEGNKGDHDVAMAAALDSYAAYLYFIKWYNPERYPSTLKEMVRNQAISNTYHFDTPVASARFFEYVIKEIKSDSNLHSDLGNLACMYHAYALSQTGSDREGLKHKTMQLFQEAISLPDAQAPTYADYCTFLVNFEMYPDAVPVLQKALGKFPGDYTGGNSYQGNEKETVDENLQKEIEKSSNKAVSVISYVYIHYLLVRSLVKLNKSDDAEAVMAAFQIACDEMPTETQAEAKAMNFNLMGYAWKAVGKFDEAVTCFSKVQELMPEWPTAEENITDCAIQMSMES